MLTVSKVQSNQYLVSDGRSICRQGSGWYLVSESGRREFGPFVTLESAKRYVSSSHASLSPSSFCLNIRLLLWGIVIAALLGSVAYLLTNTYLFIERIMVLA